MRGWYQLDLNISTCKPLDSLQVLVAMLLLLLLSALPSFSKEVSFDWGEFRRNTVQTSPDIDWLLMPDDNGKISFAILSGAQRRDMPDVSVIRFLLWTRRNPEVAEQRALTDKCEFINLCTKRKTVIMIHGFGDTVNTSIMYPLLKNTFLDIGDYNVIGVNWGPLAAAPWYCSAVDNTPLVGGHTAEFIDQLLDHGVQLDDITLIGFSLGAHVVGIASQHVKKAKLNKIIGLDPAQILFLTKPNDLMLDKDDANLVEVIHTSGGALAFEKPLGHVDFYPNGGFWPQPGCRFDFVASCSHRRAYYYFAEALTSSSKLQATPCHSWKAFKNDECDQEIRVPMWVENVANNTRNLGKAYLRTKSQQPFSNNP